MYRADPRILRSLERGKQKPARVSWLCVGCQESCEGLGSQPSGPRHPKRCSLGFRLSPLSRGVAKPATACCCWSSGVRVSDEEVKSGMQRITLKTVVFMGSARNVVPPWGGDVRLGDRVLKHVVSHLRARDEAYAQDQINHEVTSIWFQKMWYFLWWVFDGIYHWTYLSKADLCTFRLPDWVHL